MKWGLDDDQQLVPYEFDLLVVELEVFGGQEWHKSFDEEEGQGLEIGTCKFSVEVACLIAFQPREEVLIELCQELSSVFEGKLVVLVIFKVYKMKHREY